MKSFLIMAALGLLIISCDNDTPQPLQPQLKPASYEELNYKKEYIYNTNNQLAQIKYITTFVNGEIFTSIQDFFYLPDGKLKEATSDTGFKFVYTYSKNKIIRTDEYINDVWTQHHTFLYDSKGKLTLRTTYQDIPEEGGIIPVSKEEYQYTSNDNLELLNLYYYTSNSAEPVLLTSISYSNYDNLPNVADQFNVNISNPNVTIRKNNPGKMTIRNGSGNVVSTEETVYQHNTDNSIVNRTTTITFYNGNISSYESHFIFQ